MVNSDYDDDHKYCHACQRYVPYLVAVDCSYCTCCGGRVRLFSNTDWSAFWASDGAQVPGYFEAKRNTA